MYVAIVGFFMSFSLAIVSGYFPVAMADQTSDEFQMNQAALQQFAGDIALQYNPYVLLDVRSPGYIKFVFPNPIPQYVPDGDPVARDRYYPGSPYGEIGVTNSLGVTMDASQKSSMRLGNNAFGMWSHTGYRYVFAPSVDATRDQWINVIWYKFGNEQGLDAGVDVSFLDKRFAFLSATDIISNYDTNKQVGEYKFRLGDRSVYVLLKFNVTALQINGGDYYKTFDEGGWSINVAKKTMVDSDDISPDMLDAVVSIVKMNNPNLPGDLQILMFLLVVVPSTVAIVSYIRDFFKL